MSPLGDVWLDHLIDIYSYAGRAPVIIIYAAIKISGELAVDDEGLEAREFDLDAIPWDELAFRSTNEALRGYLAAKGSDPSGPASTTSGSDPAHRRHRIHGNRLSGGNDRGGQRRRAQQHARRDVGPHVGGRDAIQHG